MEKKSYEPKFSGRHELIHQECPFCGNDEVIFFIEPFQGEYREPFCLKCRHKIGFSQLSQKANEEIDWYINMVENFDQIILEQKQQKKKEKQRKREEKEQEKQLKRQEKQLKREEKEQDKQLKQEQEEKDKQLKQEQIRDLRQKGFSLRQIAKELCLTLSTVRYYSSTPDRY
jgi:uncharacterized protein with von Willebrand factor type A (vWA) domain